MKKLLKQLTLLSLFVILVFSGLPAEEAPMEVVQAAQKGIANFAKVGPQLAKPAALDNTGLFYGFQVYTVDPEEFVHVSSLDGILKPTGLWRFVLAKDNQPLSLLTVARVEDSWTAVSIGAAQLAAEVKSVIERWPAEAGYDFRFIRIYQARCDFIQVSKDNRTVGLIPLAASRQTLKMDDDFDPGRVLRFSEIQVPLQGIVFEEMKRRELEK
ncbi:MAG: hypothetical protein KAW12_30710 [Candidatus Aminicenantes bacterium]|nr:hypothetical protein [Candidatus Aminicenantes bacterium]